MGVAVLIVGRAPTPRLRRIKIVLNDRNGLAPTRPLCFTGMSLARV